MPITNELVGPVTLPIDVSCHAILQTDSGKAVLLVFRDHVGDRDVPIAIVFCLSCRLGSLDSLLDRSVELIMLNDADCFCEQLFLVELGILGSSLPVVGVHPCQLSLLLLVQQAVRGLVK